MKGKILIIGQLPPPYHGSNIMAETMLSALKSKDYETIFIDKLFAKSIDTIGKPSLRKFSRVPVLTLEILIACVFKKPLMCIYFIAVGKSAFIIDAFLLFLIKAFHVPYILRFGGKGYHELQNEGLIWNNIVSKTLKNALGGIVLGQSIKWDVNMFIPDNRLVYVPNGIAFKPIQPLRKHSDCVKILYLSNLVPSKGPLEVIKAAKIVTQNLDNVLFIIAGATSSASFLQKIKSFITDNRLNEFVSMPGRVYGDEKERLFATSDIFVFPSYFKLEIFGLVNIEAMSRGLPVISSNEGVIPEIVQDGITGFIVNPRSPDEIAAKIIYLVNNPELRKKMGMKGREVFESKYTLEAHAIYLDRAIKFFGELQKGDKARKNKH